MPFPSTPHITDAPTPHTAIQLASGAPWFPFGVRLRLQCDTGPAFPRPAILQIQWVWRFKSQDRSMRKTSSWGAGPPGTFLLDPVPSSLSLQEPRLSFKPGAGCSAPWPLGVGAGPAALSALGQAPCSRSPWIWTPSEARPWPLTQGNPACPTQTIKALLSQTQGLQRVRKLCDHGCPGQSRQVGRRLLLMWKKRKQRDEGKTGDTSAGSEASPHNTTPSMGRGAQRPLLTPSLTGSISAYEQMAGQGGGDHGNPGTESC